eukprot:gene8363-903_t
MSENELADKLARRARINEGEEKPGVKASTRFNPYVEFPDMSRKEIKEYERIFKQYDTSGDNFIDLMELKYMMEKLGHPQAALGELQADGLAQMATSVDVSEVGAKGAACFFEKLAEKQNREKKFEDEIRSEQEEKRREAEEARRRKVR